MDNDNQTEAIEAKMADPEFQAAYQDSAHPLHTQAVDEMLSLHSKATGETVQSEPQDPTAQALQAPESPERYELGNLENATNATNPETRAMASQLFHDGGVPSWVANAIYLDALARPDEEISHEAASAEEAAVTQKLVSEWGQETFNAVIEQAQQVIERMGPAAVAYLDSSGLGNSETVLRTFKNWFDLRG